jgi:TM2 domain-containing membrane protein YozV
MKSALRAALLSGLVFPSLKQIYLKRYWRGLLFIILIMLGLVILAGVAAAGALDSLNTIQAQGGTVDIDTISKLTSKHPSQKGVYYKVIFLYIICCWFFSVIDAYRLGKGKNSTRQV